MSGIPSALIPEIVSYLAPWDDENVARCLEKLYNMNGLTHDWETKLNYSHCHATFYINGSPHCGKAYFFMKSKMFFRPCGSSSTTQHAWLKFIPTSSTRTTLYPYIPSNSQATSNSLATYLTHRDDNWPALEERNGTKIYCKYGKTHRTRGPAILRPNGAHEYWIHGQRIEMPRKRLSIACNVAMYSSILGITISLLVMHTMDQSFLVEFICSYVICLALHMFIIFRHRNIIDKLYLHSLD